MSIYANRKDANGFSSIARKVKDSGDSAAWAQAVALGYSIDPSNPMYEEGKDAAGAAEMPDALSESGKPQAAVPLDMDVGFDIPMDLDVTAAMPAATQSAEQGAASEFDVSVYDNASPMDLDVTGSQPNVIAESMLPDFDVTGGHAPVEQSGATDFDVTGGQPDLAATQTMDFDVTGAYPGAEEVVPGMDFGTGAASESAPSDFGGLGIDVSAAGEPAEPSGSMDFDIGAASEAESDASGLGGLGLDISTEQGESVAEAAEAETNESPEDGGLAFDLGESFAVPEESVETTQVNVPQTAGDGGMDFDVSIPSGIEAPAEEAAAVGETEAEEASSDVGGLAFDLGESFAAPEESVETTQVNVPQTSGDGGMDFDVSAPAEIEAPAEEAAGVEESSGIGGLAFDLSGAQPASAESVETTQVNVPQTAGDGGMDFDISAAPGIEASEEVDAGEATGGAGESFGVEGLAFDLSDSQPSVETTQVNVSESSGGGMAFDTSGAEPSALEASSGGLDFDISASQPAASAPEGDLASTVVLDGTADFDISAPLDTTAALEPHTEFAAAAEEGGPEFDLSAASSLVVPNAGEEMAGLAGGVDLDLSGAPDFDISAAPGAESADQGLGGIALDLGGEEDATGGEESGEAGAEVENKLELARAFQEMGDADTARELLGEVVKEGNSRQIESAQQLIQQL